MSQPADEPATVRAFSCPRHRETMSPADIIGAAQLIVAVYGLQLQIMMTPAAPDRFFKRTTDRHIEFGPLKIRSRTSTTRRQ